MMNIDAIEWPKHDVEMVIFHNQHNGYYQSISEAIGDEDSTYDRADFPDEAEIQKAIDTDSVWVIQWYPDNLVGFCRVCAATLSRALAESKR